VLLNHSLYLNYFKDIARVEAIAGVLIKIIISWNIMPYRWVNIEWTRESAAPFHRIPLFQQSEYSFQ
jgi:hypothetical protein